MLGIDLQQQVDAVKAAPVLYIAALVAVGVVEWLILKMMKAEQIASLQSRLQLRDDEIADYRRKASADKVATPREPDGLYQHGRLVAHGKGSSIELSRSSIEFGSINADGDFNPETEFEFRDWRVIMTGFAVSNRVTTAGFGRSSFTNAECRILGPLKAA